MGESEQAVEMIEGWSRGSRGEGGDVLRGPKRGKKEKLAMREKTS